ncbi:MAG: pcaG [Homoserinimonas sp.]|nr:pcaG [Homoserinimonas sp.]
MTALKPATPGQTIGPFFGYALPYEGGENLVDRTHPAAVRLHGRIFDGAGVPVPDAVVEIWQVDEKGAISDRPGSINRDGYNFTGFGRAAVDGAGAYQFTTVEPGGERPFFSVVVFARGLLDKLHTRIYVPETVDLTVDPLLSSLPPERAATLIAEREPNGNLLFDIVLQGDEETVFLDFD